MATSKEPTDFTGVAVPPGPAPAAPAHTCCYHVRATKAVLADREQELIELKGPCMHSGRCRLHYAHSGPCDMGNPRGYHPTCIETTGAVEISQGRRSFVCGPDCPPPVADSCTGCTAAKGDPDCPVHEGRKPRGPKPPPLGAGCICDGSGRACPRHGEVM